MPTARDARALHPPPNFELLPRRATTREQLDQTFVALNRAGFRRCIDQLQLMTTPLQRHGNFDRDTLIIRESGSIGGNLPRQAYRADLNRDDLLLHDDLRIQHSEDRLKGGGLARRRAAMRLIARDAELCAMMFVERKVTQDQYCALERLESSLTARSGQHDPVVLSGRMARRYIRFLSSNPILRSTVTSDSLNRTVELGKIRELLGFNMSRLRRFSGADRVE